MTFDLNSSIKNQQMFWDPKDPFKYIYKVTFQCGSQASEQITSDKFFVDGLPFYLQIYSSGKTSHANFKIVVFLSSQIVLILM